MYKLIGNRMGKDWFETIAEDRRIRTVKGFLKKIEIDKSDYDYLEVQSHNDSAEYDVVDSESLI